VGGTGLVPKGGEKSTRTVAPKVELPPSKGGAKAKAPKGVAPKARTFVLDYSLRTCVLALKDGKWERCTPPKGANVKAEALYALGEALSKGNRVIAVRWSNGYYSRITISQAKACGLPLPKGI